MKQKQRSIFQRFFGKTFGFRPVDPLADGLAEDIRAEQREPQAIRLYDDDSDALQRFWQTVEDDLRRHRAADCSE